MTYSGEHLGPNFDRRQAPSSRQFVRVGSWCILKMSATCAVVLSHCTRRRGQWRRAHCLCEVHTHLFRTLQIVAALVCGDGSASGAKVDGTDAAFAPRRSHPAGMLLASCDAGMFGTQSPRHLSINPLRHARDAMQSTPRRVAETHTVHILILSFIHGEREIPVRGVEWMNAPHMVVQWRIGTAADTD